MFKIKIFICEFSEPIKKVIVLFQLYGYNGNNKIKTEDIDMEIMLTGENFESEVLKSELPVLVDFFADWCGPCKMLSPTIKQIAEEYAGKVKVGKVNVDDERELAEEYDIMYIPTLIVFKNGAAVAVSNGLKRKDEIIKMLGV